MNLSNKRLDVAFGLCLLLTLTIPNFFPWMRLLFFAPFVIMAIYKRPRVKAMCLAAVCGLIIDLLAANSRLGIHMTAYALASAALYSQKRNFFADSLTTLPIMTFLFSILSSALTILLYLLFDKLPSLSIMWAMTDLFLLPLADAFYGFIVFILPVRLFGKAPRKGQDYFLSQDD